ncbi:MAG: hypothetical protein ACK55I_16340, partial [bacterium]
PRCVPAPGRRRRQAGFRRRRGQGADGGDGRAVDAGGRQPRIAGSSRAVTTWWNTTCPVRMVRRM